MAGPTAGIELDGPVPDAALAVLKDELAEISTQLETPRHGYLNLNIEPAALGVTHAYAHDVAAQPFVVHIMGPGFGDEAIFEAEHSDGPDLLALIGFRPPHAMGVLAMCNGRVNHDLTALLTARVMDIIGGVAAIELYNDQVDSVRALPGLRALAAEPWPEAYGSAQFVRAWAAHPAFRLVK